jgi:hypothetical protein
MFARVRPRMYADRRDLGHSARNPPHRTRCGGRWLFCAWDYDVELSAAVWYMSYGLYGRTRMEATARDLHDALALQ